MKVLVACEESQAVCTAFREKGHEAYSCDIIDCSGGHPEWHIKWDALALINGNCSFLTCDGELHKIDGKWDMLIAHPPCTHLAISGARHFEKKRIDGRQREGIEFFCRLLEADCDRIAIENPVNIISGDYVGKWFPDIAERYSLPLKPTQTIQPYQFGAPARKTTNLWLRGLPPLTPTETVEPDLVQYTGKGGKVYTFSADYGPGDKEAGSRRSKTYKGIAKAMAEQWG